MASMRVTVAPVTAATFLLAWAPASMVAAQSVSLPDAINQSSVEMRFEASGDASGDIVVLHVHRLVPAPVSIAVQPVVLSSGDSAHQNLVLRRVKGEMVGSDSYIPQSSIQLSDGNWHDYLLEAYCINAHAANPQVNGQYALDGPPDSRLAAILSAADSSYVQTDVLQAAIWAVTDNITQDQLGDIGYGLSSDQVASVRMLMVSAGLDPTRFALSR